MARLGAGKLWKSLREQPFVNALGALTGNQAVQMVRAGLKAIYLSGWQVAADANLAGEMDPDEAMALIEAGNQPLNDLLAAMHTKALVVDGKWAIVGSANMDIRSKELNQEAVIGVVFILGATGSVLLLASNVHGSEHLRDLLVG